MSETPASGNLYERLQALSPAKRELLLARLKQAGLAADVAEPAIPPLTPLCQGDDRPLSFAQERMWFLHQFDPACVAYNSLLTLDWQGEVQPALLEKALYAIVRRHAVWRTSFPAVDGRPKQESAAELAVALPLIDLSTVPEVERENEARRRAAQLAGEPFELSRGPVWRAALLRLAAQQHVLALAVHHIAFDGWSRELFTGEMATLYAAFVQGLPDPLPPLALQYADFAAWQRKWLQGPVLERQIAYWRQQLQHAEPLALPLDHPRPPRQTFAGGHHTWTIPDTLQKKIREVCHEQGVTLFMALLSAFYILLHRYSRQTDICIGSPIANRTRPELEGMIGFFANTLVLRADVAGNPTVSELLSRVRQMTLAAYACQDLPFEKLVGELQPDRDMSRNALVQVTFTLQNVPRSSWSLPGLQLQRRRWETGTTRFDLELYVWDDEPELSVRFVYNSDLFAHATVERMAGHYLDLLQAVANDQTQRIGEIPLPGTRTIQRPHNLSEPAAWPPDSLLHRLFARQAALSPQATAVVCQEHRLSYGELNLRANRLAHRLQKLGVGPEVLVGLYLDRSPELIVAILSVLKAGGAYLPLDPQYPKQRLAFMLQDAGSEVVLTRQALLPDLPSFSGRMVCCDDDCAGEPDCDLPDRVDADNPAYVIYTSGSTGKPKGVFITHRNVVRLFTATAPWFHFCGDDVWTMFHSCAFDFSVWELWGALLYGGTLVIVPYSISRAPEEFYRLLVEHGVTVLNQTPSAFRQLMQVDSQSTEADRLRLRYVIFGGEALELSILRPWFARHGDTPRLINMYGITETTVHVTYRPIAKADVERGAGSVIGAAIADLELYLLDDYGQTVPEGVAGEICVGGAGLARGYLRRPELTAEKFVPNPFGDRPGERLYRSGDLARWLSDGDLEFLGRSDQQIKIRGFRIELGEIEAVLGQLPEVREVVVTAREYSPGDKRLVAYVVAQPGMPPAIEQWREFLCGKLPDYMVPVAFVLLEKLPLTPSGKVDRQSLPSPELTPGDSGRTFVAPQTPEEKTLAIIWQDILHHGRPGVDDDFFALGGHSLLMIQLAARIEAAFTYKLPLTALFEATTIRRQAAMVARHAAPTSDAALLAIRTGSDNTPLFWVHGGDSLYFMKQDLPAAQPIYWIKDFWREGNLPTDATIESMAAAHLQEIRCVQNAGPYLLGGYSLGGLIAFEMARQLQQQGEKISLLFLLDAYTPYQTSWQQFKARLARHWRRLRTMSAGACWRYAWALVNGKWQDWRARLHYQLGSGSGNLPLDVVYVQRKDLFARCLRAYTAHTYAGKAVLWTSQDAGNMKLVWEQHFSEGLEVHELTCAHRESALEPHVHQWLKHLRECLAQAQSQPGVERKSS